ncbi:hypothetical protein Ddye_020487 [Dipteronia dyeriana]|uniref:Transposase n=1 Tax=Dipteronia dyeriana TaxID=168575 RepID=A0AAD9U006_9ROSI|nr:hypothetical protein Ddye_020487 [Dipteronia dyeriana]
MEPRKPDDEQPDYDPRNLNNYFSFMVHHGGEFDGNLYLQPIHSLQVVSNIELLPSQEGEIGDSIPENIIGDVPHDDVGDGLGEGVGDGLTEGHGDGPTEDRNKPNRVAKEFDCVGESTERAVERKKKKETDSKRRHSSWWFCVKHLYNNFKSKHNRLLLKQILWSAAKSTTEQGFTQSMERMMSECVAAYEWLADKDPHHWSRAYFKDTVVCDMLCNNMCKAFNKAILQARDKPVIILMEMIKNYLMKRLVKKKPELKKWKFDIEPNVFRFLVKLKTESSTCRPKYSGNLKYHMKGPGDELYVVDIDTKTYACNLWQLIGIPYIHRISYLLSSNRDPMDCIDYMYKKESFIKAYEQVIYSINGPSIWLKTNDKPVQCPQFKKQRGRPKKSRNLQFDEVRI